MQALTEAACSTAHADAPTMLPGAAHATVALLLSKGEGGGAAAASGRLSDLWRPPQAHAEIRVN